MGFAKQWTGVNKYMVKSPETFFSEYDETHGIGYPLAFMLISYLAVMVPIAALSTLINITTPRQAVLGLVAFAGFGVGFWILGLIEALLAHVIMYLFGARGVAKTLEAYAFPTVVRYGLWWIPPLSLVWLYGFYLQIKGLATFHDISTGKAAVAAILAAIFYLLPVFLVIAAVIGAFVMDLGSSPGPQSAALLFAAV